MAEVLLSLRLDAGDDGARTCARVLGAAGVAVSLLVGEDRSAEPLWCYPEISARFEELQYTLGEGPGPDAVHTGSPIVEPDLARVRADRWPALLPEVQRLGVQGVCVLPLGVGAIRVGVLTVLCSTPRGMSRQQYEDAAALAAALTNSIITADGSLDGRHVNGRRPDVNGSLWHEPSGLHRTEVHQATGMVSVQLGVSMAEALARLRAYAYGNEQPLGTVAQDVVARKLRFDDDIGGPGPADCGKG